jgi:hypothetical protein
MVPITLIKPKLLLGEGEDEKSFFEALLAHMGLAEIQVIQYGGKTRLGGYLQALVASSGFHDSVFSLGITRDADGVVADAMKSIDGILKKSALPSPGGAAKGSRPRVAIFILPDQASPGMLEDLCLRALATNPECACLDGYFDCIRDAKDLPSNMSKARMRAWLSSQEPPDLDLGMAAKKGLIPWSSPVFDPLKTFLSGL